MEIQKDFKELLELLIKNEVDFMIVGGYALAFHGAPRYTGDIDLFIKIDSVNAVRVMRALEAFGFGNIDVTESDFLSPNKVVQIGVPPVRIDIITSFSLLSPFLFYFIRLYRCSSVVFSLPSSFLPRLLHALSPY